MYIYIVIKDGENKCRNSKLFIITLKDKFSHFFTLYIDANFSFSFPSQIK